MELQTDRPNNWENNVASSISQDSSKVWKQGNKLAPTEEKPSTLIGFGSRVIAHLDNLDKTTNKLAPSAKAIADFLNSPAGRDYIHSRPPETVTRIHAYLQEKTQTGTWKAAKSYQSIILQGADPSAVKKSIEEEREYRRGMAGFGAIIKKSDQYEFSGSSVQLKNEHLRQFVQENRQFLNEKFSEIGDIRHLDQLVKEGTKGDIGTTKELQIGGKTYHVSAITNSSGNKAIEIHQVVKKIAQGAFGVVSAVESSNPSHSLVLKRALEGNTSAAEDVQTDVANLQEINNGKINTGIQPAPHSVVVMSSADGTATIKGYLADRFDGSGSVLSKDQLGNMTPNSRIEIGLKLISTINKGISTVLERGFLHLDHKLDNTLYKQDNLGNFNIVVSDFGGDIKLNDLPKNIELYHSLVNQMKELENQGMKNSERYFNLDNQRFDLLDQKIRGASTGITTNSNDIDSARWKSLMTRSSDEDFRSIRELGEKRVVYSNAIMSLALLCGMDEASLVKNSQLFSIGISSGELMKDIDSLAKFKEVLMAFSDQNHLQLDRLNPVQLDVLYRSLNNDYTKRPTMREFSKAFSGVTIGNRIGA